MEFQHKPVLFYEAIASLEIRPDGVYIDGTAGGGGHSKAIADRLTTGTLLSIDQDPDAVAVVKERLKGMACSTVVRANFSDMDRGALCLWMAFCWISVSPPISWIRRSVDSPIIPMHRSICV